MRRPSGTCSTPMAAISWGGMSREALPVEADVAGPGTKQPADGPQSGRLASAIRPNERDDLFRFSTLIETPLSASILS